MLIAGCSSNGSSEYSLGYFRLLAPEETNIDFANELVYDKEFNVFTYRNFYNGGGVAIGDVSGDSLPDIYFTSNQGENKLYLNKGDMQFEDISSTAGVGGTRGWSTGVSMVDINSDGLLDIYVCNSGRLEGDDRANELFVNLGDGKFTEQARGYGLDDRGLSTHAAFFDYDRDGDLDVYLLNNSFTPIGSFNLKKRLRGIRDSVGGDKLFKNLLVETGTANFEDVSAEAGIFGSVIGFGLGVTVGDVNLDGWLDMYVSNDFFERDYLYINQQNGTFSEQLTSSTASTSSASMGADLADINGDLYPDIFVTDMLPSSDRRLKMNTTFESYSNYQNKLANDYYHQFTRNTLQLNRGDGTFSEVSRAAGVEASDWSWGALLADLDSDGDRDIFVANGIYQDLTNQDYLAFISSAETKQRVTEDGEVNFSYLIDAIPSEPVKNVVFENLGLGEMKSAGDKFGLGTEGFSNGAAYGDLDGDGDLDLVVNNVNQKAWIYRNDIPRDSVHHTLSLILQGDSLNRYAYGARVEIEACGALQSAELMPTRGFQSSMEPIVFLGLGACDAVTTTRIYWPSGDTSEYRDLTPGTHRIAYSANDVRTNRLMQRADAVKPAYVEVDAADLGITWLHEENEFVDFDRERLLYQSHSASGPCVAVGDIDGDGFDDLYFGGAKDQAGALYRQTRQGSFVPIVSTDIASDARSEDVAAHFFDADSDGDLDLLVASGGLEFGSSSTALTDRLYLNDGRGGYNSASRKVWPGLISATSSYALADIDGDGDVDLFRGAGSMPNRYGIPTPSSLLRNDAGTFVDTRASAFDSLGIVTAAAFADTDGDGDQDLLVAGEWSAPTLLINGGSGEFTRMPSISRAGDSDEKLTGWWNAILPLDVDGDGDIDFALGNHGLNSRFKASPEQPVTMVVGDFDGNGTPEQIISRFIEGVSLPLNLRHDMVAQMPGLKKKYLKYDAYPGQSVTDMFDSTVLAQSLHYQVQELRSGYLIDTGGSFAFEPWPFLAQLSPVYAISLVEAGPAAVLTGGNFYRVKPEVGRYGASEGVLVTTENNEPLPSATQASTQGLRLRGEVRAIDTLTIGGVPYLVVGRNNDSPQFFRRQAKANDTPF